MDLGSRTKRILSKMLYNRVIWLDCNLVCLQCLDCLWSKSIFSSEECDLGWSYTGVGKKDCSGISLLL